MACHVVLTGNIQVTGLNGTRRWFFTQESYCFIQKVRLLVSCNECSKDTSSYLAWFYEVDCCDEIYRIPAVSVVESDQNSILPLMNDDGSRDPRINKTKYEQINKDKDYPANGDYRGYIQKELGIKHTTGPQYSGDSIIAAMKSAIRQTRQRGISNESTDM